MKLLCDLLLEEETFYETASKTHFSKNIDINEFRKIKKEEK